MPGATGLIALIVGLFASSQLPVTAAGVVLLVLGVGLLIAETQLPTGGIMGVLGVVSLAISGLLLFDTNEDFEVSAPLVIAIAVVFGTRRSSGSAARSWRRAAARSTRGTRS